MEKLVLSTLIYLVMKLLGYTGYSWYLNKIFKCEKSAWKVGFTRTIIGILLGTTLHYLFWKMDSFGLVLGFSRSDIKDNLVYLMIIILLRIFEWRFLIYIFYESMINNKYQLIFGIVGGVLVSFILDLPILLGLITIIKPALC